MLVASIPSGWSVVSAGTGTADISAGTVTWTEGNLQADARVGERLRLRAPMRSPEGR